MSVKKISFIEMTTSLLFFAVGIYYLVSIIPGQVESFNPSHPNATTFPYVTGIIFTFLSLLWCINTLRGQTIESLDYHVLLNILLISAGLFALTYFVIFLGYLIGGALSIMVIMVACNGKESIAKLVISSFVLSVVYYLLFIKMMSVDLGAFPAF